jgi:nucleolar protein 4
MSGFAFVTMKKQAAAERAIKESVGLQIDGREVAVDLAVQKSKWEEIKQEEPSDEEDEEEEEEDEEDEEEIEEDNKEDQDEDKQMEDGEENVSDSEDMDDLDELNQMNSDDEVDDDVELEIEEQEKPKQKSNRQEAYSLFIRNIPYDADEVSLKEHFSQFGTVKYALPVIDKVTGIAKGSAFVAFKDEDAYTKCLDNAPSSQSTSILIPDDVSPAYVYQGRILSITAAVDRQSAARLEERNSEQRKEAFGKAPSEKDKRNLFLLNEGRITENSALAKFISKTDLELREKSYKLRVQQLNKNPSLHLSLTRLAIRNLPRAMNSKALKALGRKAVVQFATEVKEEKRQPLSKEEINRSVKYKHELGEFETEQDKDKKKNDKHKGVVKQAKVIMEVKGSGDHGRSRGYGFIEFRDHKTALMGLRWLNAHEVTIAEITEGLTDEEKKTAELEGLSKRRLIVEFAVENAQVVKRRRDKVFMSRQHKAEHDSKKRERTDNDDNEPSRKRSKNDKHNEKRSNRKGNGKKGNMKKGNMNKGNMNKGTPTSESKQPNKSGLSDDVKRLIGKKRKHRKGKA